MKKGISVQIRISAPITTSEIMIINAQTPNASGFAGGLTKYIAPGQSYQPSGAFTNFDPSDPTNGEPGASYIVSQNGSISNVTYYGNLPAIAQTHTATLMKNGVATAITISVTSADDDGNSNAKKSVTVGPLSVIAGDLLAWKLIASAGANSLIPGVSTVFTPS